uniref:Uncharacterized protein n=1 Tax=Avena sativa TaxID=4498 RepID=A0ACD5TR25_AVESA
MTAERPPIDLVLVLHVRKGCPAPVEWRRLLMEAVVVTLGKLGHNDRLAVLADSRARGVRKPEEEMDKELTQSMYAKYWKEVALMQVSDENCRQVQVSAVNKAIRSETLMVTALELANSMLHNREYGDKENRTAYVIVISNSDEQDIGSLLAWRSLSVHAFGFRDAHNARTMCAIASGSPECTYALLDDERGGMTKAFAACIDRITSAGVANMPIEVKLKCERKVVLEAIDAPRISYFISSEKDVGTIWTSTQQACACVPTTKFIVYLKPREGEEKLNNMDLLKFFTVRVKYGHITTANAPDGKLLDGKVVGGNYVVPKVKTMEQRGEVVLVRKGVEIYKEMAAEMVRIKAVKIVADITREEDPNQLIHLVNLAEKLHERWTALLNNSGCGQEAGDLISMLALQMQEMQLRLHNNYFWLEYMLSWQSHQLWQLPLPPLFMDKRATQVDDPPLQLAIFPKDRATPWGNEYTVPRQLKVAVRVTAPGLKRCPVDLIAVLDASCACAAGGEKAQKRLRLLVEATELVMTKLHDHMDRLAIMHVNQPDAASLTSLTDMSEESRNKISAMLKSSLVVVSKPPPAMANENATQTSHWREQLHNKAMKLVRKLLSSASANTALTPPERQSTAAVGGSSNLWKALEGAKQILVNRLQAEKEQRAGFIIVISDSNDDSIIHEAPRRPETDFDYIVHAVSFHDSGPRNTRAMNHIAHCSNGIYAVLDDGQYYDNQCLHLVHQQNNFHSRCVHGCYYQVQPRLRSFEQHSIIWAGLAYNGP